MKMMGVLVASRGSDTDSACASREAEASDRVVSTENGERPATISARVPLTGAPSMSIERVMVSSLAGKRVRLQEPSDMRVRVGGGNMPLAVPG